MFPIPKATSSAAFRRRGGRFCAARVLPGDSAIAASRVTFVEERRASRSRVTIIAEPSSARSRRVARDIRLGSWIYALSILD